MINYVSGAQDVITTLPNSGERVLSPQRVSEWANRMEGAYNNLANQLGAPNDLTDLQNFLKWLRETQPDIMDKYKAATAVEKRLTE